MHTVNPVKLEYLMERFIIAFEYHQDKRRYTIISSYPERSPGSVRDLVGLVFTGVNHFVRKAGDLPRLKRFRYRYAAKDDTGNIVFEHIETRSQNGRSNYVGFWFGPNMGGISFEYEHLEVHRRGSRILEVGKDFIYFDTVTMEKFDQYNPFPQLLDVSQWED